ncbi:MAG: pyruvate formate lyase family protein [Bacillota bacterium]
MKTSFLAGELEFTETYRKYQNAHPAVREVNCLRSMFPYYFQKIRHGDLFAGRVKYGLVGFGLENTNGGSLYFCKFNKIRRLMDQMQPDEACAKKVQDMLDFWRDEVFMDDEVPANTPITRGKIIRALPPDVFSATSNTVANMGGRLAGTCINYEKLMRIGLPGLKREITHHMKLAEQSGGDVELYQAMLTAAETLADICRQYAVQARELADVAPAAERREELRKMAEVLDNIAENKPGTMREGLQLMWLYALAGLTSNFGRMDVYLGDLYARDLAAGILTETKALELLQSMWRLIVERRKAAGEIAEFNARIVIGGKGRRNEADADRFAVLAMEASRTVIETEPQLTLRCYQGMNPSLLAKAYDCIGEGRIYPMLYNDEVNIPAVACAFGVSMEEACLYFPYGCGEYVLEYTSVGSPNCSLNLLKALEVALHNGRDALTGKVVGPRTGDPADFDTFEKLLDAYKKQVEYFVAGLARRHAIEYEVEKQSAAFLFVSMLYDYCLEKGRSVVDRGAKYQGGVIESFAIVNTADSLTAIKEIVYDEKRLTLPRLIEILAADYRGYEKEHRLFLDAPKFGNDLEKADTMAQLVSDHVCEATRTQAAAVGLDYFLAVNINNYFNVELGKITAASADGRKAGAPLANGNTPTAGMDKNGVTAFLNSLVKISPYKHAGYVHNMKFSKRMFREERGKFEALLSTYFQKGGTQAMITAVDRGDLEKAMKEPEKYRNLIVRVGGFSARFVELSREVQLDVLKRTLY